MTLTIYCGPHFFFSILSASKMPHYPLWFSPDSPLLVLCSLHWSLALIQRNRTNRGYVDMYAYEMYTYGVFFVLLGYFTTRNWLSQLRRRRSPGPVMGKLETRGWVWGPENWERPRCKFQGRVGSEGRRPVSQLKGRQISREFFLTSF